MDRSDRVSRDNPAPLWAQVRDDLVARIESGEFTSRLPSNVDLIEQYQVGRITVARAVRELAAAGKVTVVTGVGTFVADK